MKKINNALRKNVLIGSMLLMPMGMVNASVVLESEVQITQGALHFDGKKVARFAEDNGTETYDYFFGPHISAHGDSIKKYKDYIFLTWYKGGKQNREVMLSRYNTKTGTIKTIEFPHRHTGFLGQRHIGESHNYISVAISPIDGTIHMLYDMHAYGTDRPADGSFSNDYFRYSYTVPGAADVSDDEFTLDKFIKDTSPVAEGPDDYKHLSLTGEIDYDNYSGLTYPTFFTNADGTLLVYMRKGGNNNGGYVFSHYNADESKWTEWNQFNVLDAKSHGNDYNWGLYGSMKYVNDKLRVGFQQRAKRDDKYVYQNGVFYAYSDHPSGEGNWKNHKGESMSFPLINTDEIKVFEPGDYISHTEQDSVHIVQNFDWTVTEKGDIHIISRVKSRDNKRPDFEMVHLHSYKPAGAQDFIISDDFAGATNIHTAGDDIYIIGLNKQGRPYVEKAKGGTNDFERVYEADSGKQFSHGKVHIKDGKLYYYLMERSEGTSRPLHLQVIDLDI
ncbi:BNR-4 repeat-containing protein [Vibrio agarivorans]|uniref:BNR-4 repeat-containing protein n=1 Tax=Vibrio agarivorans TaxID=153622 RepID=UPI0025B31EB7|nr:BNR-4 repeat-containing protein [Vibrio agarivorans]MDN3660246.1 BNR-4 repeat-containing protein [Vibrio agarivorans]